ncbi:uncharacterized protein LOC144152193 [Haemaphysalis longicornis]
MTRSCFMPVLAGLLWQAFADSTWPSELTQDVPDSFKIMENFKSIMSIANVNNDTMFECLWAYQISINPETRTSEYIWMLQAPGDTTPPQHVLFHEQAVDGGKVHITVEDDSTVIVGTFVYTDYKNCIIEHIDFNPYHCVLWSDRAVKDSVPQHCIDKFVEFCGVKVPAHSRDLCPDGEGDY